MKLLKSLFGIFLIFLVLVVFAIFNNNDQEFMSNIDNFLIVFVVYTLIGGVVIMLIKAIWSNLIVWKN
jgi:uncharacterized integral membrane protein